MRRPVISSFSILLFVFAALPAGALELGLSFTGGTGFWDGAWSDSVAEFSDDFGQSADLSLYPTGTLAVDTIFRFREPFVVSVAVGAGSWGGRYVSTGGTAAERTSSVAAVGLEIVPSVGLRYDVGRAEFGADLRVGLGILASPVWSVEAWSSAVSVASYKPEPIDWGYFYVGAGLSYGIPAGGYDVAFLLNGDLGFAAFDSSSGAGDLITLSRIGLGVRLARQIGSKGKARK